VDRGTNPPPPPPTPLHSTPSEKSLRVFSFGIGEDISFDREIIEKYNAFVYAFDPTPRAVKFINAQDLLEKDFKFFPLGLDVYDGEVNFLLPPENDPEPSGSIFKRERLKGGTEIKVQVRCLRTLMKLTGVSKIDILKMDIEGSEFSVIDDILVNKIDFSQLCVEFHERIFTDGREKMKRAVTNLREHGYYCCACGSNGHEATFIKKALYERRE
jgi:FkbM family methyltransferase